MKGYEPDHSRDLSEIRSMMERSSKFVWISGWAGIIAGFFGLTGVYIAYMVFDFNPDAIDYRPPRGMGDLIFLGLTVWVLAAVSATLLSYNQAKHSRERFWNATSRRLLYDMAIPFFTGGILILVLVAKDRVGLIAPLSLIFYGLALYNAGRYTVDEVRLMGIVQIILGLTATWFVQYGLLAWALGFGVVHIIYGIYIHFKYKK